MIVGVVWEVVFGAQQLASSQIQSGPLEVDRHWCLKRALGDFHVHPGCENDGRENWENLCLNAGPSFICFETLGKLF